MKKKIILAGLVGLMMYGSPALSRVSMELGGGELEYTGFLRDEIRSGIEGANSGVNQNIIRLQLEVSWTKEDFGIFDEFSINTVIRPEYDTELHRRDRKNSYIGKDFNYANDPVGFAGFDGAFLSPTAGLLSTGGLFKNFTQGVWSESSLSQFDVIANNSNFPLLSPLVAANLNCKHCRNINNSSRDLALNRNDSSGALYPFRELYIDAIVDDWWLRLGKQQVVWGKTDFFRMQDIVNPMDFGQHFFFDPFEDIRIPQWIASLQYKAGDIGPFKEAAITGVWNFDKFEPVGLGGPGQAWQHPVSKEVGTFAAFNTFFSPEPCVSQATATASGAPQSTVCQAGDGRLPSGFGIPLGTTDYGIPDWKLSNTEIGGRFEFKMGEVRFALSHFYHWQDAPTIKFNTVNLNIAGVGGAGTANDALIIGLTDSVLLGAPAGGPIALPIQVMTPDAAIAEVAANGSGAAQIAAQAAIAQDNASLFYRSMGNVIPGFGALGNVLGGSTSLVFDRIHTTGLSFDYFDDYTGVVFRVESSYTFDEFVNNTYKADWVDTSDVFRVSLGMDRPTFIKFLNPLRTFFLSAQVFNTHYMDWEGDRFAGFVPPEDNIILTLFAQTQYMRDRLIPNAFYVYEDGSQTSVWGASVQFLFDNHYSIKGGINVISGGKDDAKFDVGPFASFALDKGFAQEAVFGFVKQGIGALENNDEIFLQLQYQF
ncbi:MAG: hypothetical protein COB62_07725 [Piscirickettsiaceae bacterium]|nr:MAG: hypothetical protein COB62_07725 [Piscirickettsiaceae bacterium]